MVGLVVHVDNGLREQVSIQNKTPSHVGLLEAKDHMLADEESCRWCSRPPAQILPSWSISFLDASHD